MKHLRPLYLAFAVAAITSLSACRTVRDGPGIEPDPNSRGLIYGTEPEHAPIPEKSVREGESTLRKRGADRRIDQPNG